MTRFSAEWYAKRQAEDERRRIIRREREEFLARPNIEFVNITGMGLSAVPAPPRPKADAVPSPTVRLAGAASRPPSPPIQLERDILRGVIRALALHPAVAWAHRMNTGAVSMGAAGERFMRFGFRGCSDIIGQMADGRFLAVECKRPGGRATDDQLAFLGRVERAGGVAFVAWSVADVARALDNPDAAA